MKRKKRIFDEADRPAPDHFGALPHPPYRNNWNIMVLGRGLGQVPLKTQNGFLYISYIQLLNTNILLYIPCPDSCPERIYIVYIHIQSQNRTVSKLFSYGGRMRAGQPAPYFQNPRITRRYTYKQLKDTGVWYSNIEMSGNYGDLPWAEHPTYQLVKMTHYPLDEPIRDACGCLTSPAWAYEISSRDQREMHHDGAYETNQFYFTPKVWNPETKKMEGGEVYQVWKFDPVKRN